MDSIIICKPINVTGFVKRCIQIGDVIQHIDTKLTYNFKMLWKDFSIIHKFQHKKFNNITITISGKI